VDWSLLGCSWYGHMTFAPDEPELRAQLHAERANGEAWCCLRCGTFVPGEPQLSGPAAQAPVVARGKEVRSKLILRLFSIERFVRALVFFAVAYGLWRYRSSRSSVEQAFDRKLPIVRDLFRQLGFNIEHSKLLGLLNHALALSSTTLTLLAIGTLIYAVVEVIEGTGLWLARRWGEYFAMIATSIGLPLEIYDLTRKVTVTALLLFAVNLALVLYLVITKRLFGIRGGKKAYDARLRSESVLEAAERAAAGHAGETAAEGEGEGETGRTAATAPVAGLSPAAGPAPEATAGSDTARITYRRPATGPEGAAGPPLAGDDRPLAGGDRPLAGDDRPLAGGDRPLAGDELVGGRVRVEITGRDARG
jgi:uncharacterized membrane protein (DUF2068 family)